MKKRGGVAAGYLGTTKMQTLNGIWKLARDPDNKGREGRWFEKIQPGDEDTPVPGVIQQTFPYCHGVFWYWQNFTPTVMPYPDGRCLLRFHAVDYTAEVWLNGSHVGTHAGGETPFVLDVTKALNLNAENLLAVRVLNPTNEPIDGMTLEEVPHACKKLPYHIGADFNWGGIWQSVELYAVPDPWITDIRVRPDASSGIIHVSASACTRSAIQDQVVLRVSVTPADGGDVLAKVSRNVKLPKGESRLESEARVTEPRLWSTDDPYLYRVTVRLGDATKETEHEVSVRCGFRDFRFQNGYFRLNGRRIFLRSMQTYSFFPIGLHVPHDPQLLRREMVYLKAMGFNMVRFIGSMAHPTQLDVCDEIGLLVHEESAAGWELSDSPGMAEHYDRSVREMVLRDRNRPSIVIWGMLNEGRDPAVFEHAVAALELVRTLDTTRIVLLNSGRTDKKLSVGSISNTGSHTWDYLLGAEAAGVPDSECGSIYQKYFGQGDVHNYPDIPMKPDAVHELRTMAKATNPVFLSEHANGSQMNVLRLIRSFEQAGARTDLEDYCLYKHWAEQYLADWKRFGMDEVFSRPEDFLLASQRQQSELRLASLNVIRSNPKICGYSGCGRPDTMFRELKPDAMQTMMDGWAPLRWCLFVESSHGYSSGKFKLEAVLANEDVLAGGEYPVRFRICGKSGTIWDKTTIVRVPGAQEGNEPPLAFPAFSEEVKLDAPSGQYWFTASLEKESSPSGDRVRFFVTDKADLPSYDSEVVVFGDDKRLERFLQDNRIPCRRFGDVPADQRHVILVGACANPKDDPADWEKLLECIARGSVAVFLTPNVFACGGKPLARIPLVNKGSLITLRTWAYCRDDFAKDHPIFDGLPRRSPLDPVFYRELIPRRVFTGQDMPKELVAGWFAVGYGDHPDEPPGGYYSGFHIGVYELGVGRFVINSLSVLENLGHPAADRLLMNMIRYSGKRAKGPAAPTEDYVRPTSPPCRCPARS